MRLLPFLLLIFFTSCENTIRDGSYEADVSYFEDIQLIEFQATVNVKDQHVVKIITVDGTFIDDFLSKTTISNKGEAENIGNDGNLYRIIINNYLE